MKTFPFLLVVSLVGNLALVALVLTAPAGGERDGVAVAATPSAANKPTGTTSGVAGDGVIDTSDVDPKIWSGLAAGDYAGLKAKLEAAGFPPSIVRAIINAQMGESFIARRKALMGDRGTIPFWLADQPNDPKIQAALRELSKEQSKLRRELFGATNEFDDPMYLASQRRQFGDLPTDKIEQLLAVQRDYGELRQDIYTAAGLGSGGPITLSPDERAKLALLEKEQREDIKAMFSPAEFEAYELRSSNTANQMRYSLSAFEPSEQEFRTIFQLQRVFDEQFNTQNLMAAQGNPTAQQELMRQRTEAQKQLTANVKAALGAERGAEYERAIDNNYQQISRVVQRLELPKETATQVWTLQKDMEQRAAAVRSLPPAQRTEQLAALAQEATAKLTSSLGQRGLDVYKQYGGYWLQNLQPPAARGGAGGSGAGGAAGAPIIRMAP